MIEYVQGIEYVHKRGGYVQGNKYAHRKVGMYKEINMYIGGLICTRK